MMAVMKAERTCIVDGVELSLCSPDELDLNWVGDSEVGDQLLACWTLPEPSDVPLNPRIIGKPGVGKTTLAYSMAKKMKREIYFFQATMDTRPEDLIVTPVIGDGKSIKYVASPIVTAMLRGGVAILDEGNRMSEKSWASLAPLLDSRRYVESLVAGIKIFAHSDFRFCATMNDDSSTFELPEYIFSRLQPQITIDYPEHDDELLILRQNLPNADSQVLEYILGFLERARGAGESFSIRDGINVARFAARLIVVQKISLEEAFEQSIRMTLGNEAVAYGQ